MQFAQRVLSTRGGTIAAGGLAALLSAGIFLAYLHRYRSSLNEAAEPMTVLVARSLIEKGTPGNAIATSEMFQTTTVPRRELKDGALNDPALLRGRVAVDEIYPGQQLTAADFSATPTNAIPTRLAGDQRAISVPLDAAHGMVGQVQPGDHVDVLAGFNLETSDSSKPVVKTLMADALVLAAPAEAKTGLAAGSGTSSVSLRVDAEQAAEIAWAADNGKVWIVLRPRVGAKATQPGVVLAESLLLGVKPVKMNSNLKKVVAALKQSAPPEVRAFFGGQK